ncbi:MAG: transposase family protein [Bacteroidetes bacterium]|nr:transposase family protein [Bacteroidota bacterium]
MGSLENQLLCLLIYYRTYTTQLFIGFWFRVDDATVWALLQKMKNKVKLYLFYKTI